MPPRAAMDDAVFATPRPRRDPAEPPTPRTEPLASRPLGEASPLVPSPAPREQAPKRRRRCGSGGNGVPNGRTLSAGA